MIGRIERILPRNGSTLFFLLTGAVGVAGGLSAVAFKLLLAVLMRIVFHSPDNIFDIARTIPWYANLAAPALGGLAAALVLRVGPKSAGGHGMPEIMESVAIRRGVIDIGRVLVRSIASLFVIGTGGSIGREGPIVQLGAASGSRIGRALRVSNERLRVLVACGSAAGIAAAYNTPIAATLFVLEIVLGTFATEYLGPILVSSVASTLVSRLILGSDPMYRIPAFALVSSFEVVPYLLLGIVAGLGSVLFMVFLAAGDRAFGTLRLPRWLKTPLGGLAVGAIGIWIPHVWGNGYETVSRILSGEFEGRMLLLFFAAKMIATAFTMCSGGPGGIFTPTLFIGASLGGAFGLGVHGLFPNLTAGVGPYALVGMAGAIAATTHAPLTAILMLFELTGDYGIILPLMLVCAAAYATSKLLRHDSIYTAELRRRGIAWEAPPEERMLRSLRVRDVMRRDAPLLPESLPLSEIVRIFTTTRVDVLFVGDKNGRFIGVIELRQVLGALNEQALDPLVIAYDLAKPTAVCHPDDSLLVVNEKLWLRDLGALPVVDADASRRFLGVVRRGDLATAVDREAIRRSPALARLGARQPVDAGLPENSRMTEVEIPDDLAGLTVREADFRGRLGVILVAISRIRDDGTPSRFVPASDDVLRVRDRLVLMGPTDRVERIQGEWTA
ncbi:MAG: chloride channel protein [Planctomycetes bacterium]|nr:chloride channel protein [Planctomycetota bacterium]MBI3847577.1 chloride channel protein [Planctomycetota bacterium]